MKILVHRTPNCHSASMFREEQKMKTQRFKAVFPALNPCFGVAIVETGDKFPMV